ncbi:MAG: sigma-70 family RNA polymerase sigma factor, partial [Clostridia bacterium]
LAFNELISRYAKIIKLHTNPYKFSSFDIEDLWQEGWLGFLSAVNRFDDEKNTMFKSFASVCIKNRILSAVKKIVSQKDNIKTMSLSSQTEQSTLEKSIMPVKENPESVFFDKDYEGHLFSIIKTVLTEKEYKIIILFLSGFSYDEIAKKLGVNVKSIDNSLQKIRKKIKSVV